jgi:hypothetical protein
MLCIYLSFNTILMFTHLTDDDLLNNPNKYTIEELEANIKYLNKKILLFSQTLTAEFCVRYIMDMDIDNGSEDSYIYDVNYITSFQKHLTDESILEEKRQFDREVSFRTQGRHSDPRIVDLICKDHHHLRHEVMESPCRFRCRLCGKKCVHGYTNPDHIPNPFGYLFLTPPVCIDCSISTSKCMWCSK